MHKKYVTLFFMVMEEVAHTTELCHILLPYLTTMHMITIRQIQKKKKKSIPHKHIKGRD